MSSENPYASFPIATDARSDNDDRGFDTELMAMSLPYVFIVSCFATFFCFFYCVWSAYLSVWLIHYLRLNASQEIGVILGQLLYTASPAALYGYSAYRDWMYRKALMQFLQRSISWRLFAESHARFWRGGVLVGIGAILITFAPWALSLFLAAN